MKTTSSRNSSHCIIFSLLLFSILVAQLPNLVTVNAQSKPILVTDYSFYKGDLDSESQPVTRVNGYLSNETWAKCYMKMLYLADLPEVVGIGRFYGPDDKLVQFRIRKFDAQKRGDTAIWTFSADVLRMVQNNTGIWRLEMYHGPYLLFTERFTVGDYLANIRLSGLPPRFVARIMIDGAEAGTIRGGERKSSALLTGNHTISVDAFMDADVGTRYIAKSNSWNVSSASSHAFEYSAQYYLNVSSPRGEPVGSGWYDSGSTATFTTQLSVDLGRGVRYLFTGWSGDYSGASPVGTVLMNGPKNVTAKHKIQYLLRVESQYGDPKGEGWYDHGATATLSVASIVVLADLTRLVFVRWEGDLTSSSSTVTIVMDRPITVGVNWKAEGSQPVLMARRSLFLAIGVFFIASVIGIFFFLSRRKLTISH